MRVLVVEDEALLARQLTAALRRAGYAVDHAADATTPLFSTWDYLKWMG